MAHLNIDAHGAWPDEAPLSAHPERLPSAPAGWIVAIARDRCTRAFALLFEAYAPRIKAYALRLGMSEEQAEELAQEAMLTVWRKASLFDASRASAEGWLFTIARNRRIDVLRREAHADALDATPAAQPPLTPEEALRIAESQGQVRSALADLPAAQAAVLRLSVWEERSHSEISRRLGLPLGTVKSHIRRAAARLRAKLIPLQ